MKPSQESKPPSARSWQQIGETPRCDGPSCRSGLCSKGLCPGTLLLIGFLIVQGVIALISWIRA